MAEQKTFVTPKGELRYPWLTQPDTRFDPEGKYKVVLVLDAADPAVEELVGKIQDALNEKGLENAPFKETDDGFEFKFSSAYRPGVFDAHRNRIPDEIRIGSGSVGKVAYQPNVYKGFGGGINLYLKGVQVLEFKPYVGPDAKSLGFDDGEGFDTTSEDFVTSNDAADVALDEDNMPF